MQRGNRPDYKKHSHPVKSVNMIAYFISQHHSREHFSSEQAVP